MKKTTKLALMVIILFVFSVLAAATTSAIAAPPTDRNEARMEGQPPHTDGDNPPPHPEGPRPPKDDFMKNLTPEQREQAQKFMMLAKNRIDLADIYAEQGKADEAIAEVKKVLDSEVPSFIPAKEAEERKAMLSMKVVDIYMKAGKEDQALAEAEKLVAKGNLPVQKQGHIYTMIANAYKKKGNKDKAAEYLRKSIEILEKK